ncbi:MAG TPA: GGDEF domain-containing protein [Planctomycetota bacterium]|nr:GGDEF domain-containing protein [Planctomycetota bacterium]
MKTFYAFLRAFRQRYTYDVLRNSYLWLGVFWGLLIPLFVYAFDVSLLKPGGQGPLDAVRAHPTRVVLLLQPLLMGILFGAMGSVRHDLESENRVLIESLKDLAMTDPLTGLYNRRYIKEVLKIMLETARRTAQPLFVILIDLDGFKLINDSQGHVKGDQVLCDAVRALKSILRQSDVLGRHGGDEFILVGVGDRASATVLITRAAQAVREQTGLALSSGIGCWPEGAETPDDLIGAADRFLGISKKKSHESRTLPRVDVAADVST